MNTSRFFLHTLIAAAAMTVPAYAGDTIQINFASGQGTNVYNVEGWENVTGATGTQNLTDSSGRAASVTWSSNNTWGYTNGVTDDFLKGYLDDGNGKGVSISVATSFLVADVTIYCATDDTKTEYKFTEKKVNGTFYTFADGVTVEGEAGWGQFHEKTAQEGLNSLTISGIAGEEISIFSPGEDASNRGCIAAVKIVDRSVQKAIKLNGEENLTWSGSQFGDSSWKNASAVNGWSYADITLGANSSVSVTEDISTVGIFTSGTGALTFNDGIINMLVPGKISAGENTSITFNNTLNFANGGSISGNVSFGESARINIAFGALALDLTNKTSLDLGLIAGGENTRIKVAASSVADSFTSIESISDDFKGSVEVTSGFLRINSADLESKLDGVKSIVLSGGLESGICTVRASAVEISADIIAEGNGGALRTFGSNDWGVTFAGNVSGTLLRHYDGGTHTFTGTVNLNAFNAEAGVTNFNGDQTQIGTLTISSGTTNLNGQATLGTLDASGGTTNLNGQATLGTLDASGGTVNLNGQATLEHLYAGNGLLNLNSGASVITGQLRLGEEGTSTTAINKGATLTITGRNNSHSTGASFLIAHWSQSPTLLLNGGTLVADSAKMYLSWAGTGTFSAQSGVARLKGMDFRAQSNQYRGHFKLGGEASGDATVYLGGDIEKLQGAASVTLGNGTLVATTNWSAGHDIDNNATATTIGLVGKKRGTVFDTQEHTVTINNAISGNGNLVKAGAGTLALNGGLTANAVSVEAGTLTLGGDVTLGKTIDVASGATLDFASGVNVTANDSFEFSDITGYTNGDNGYATGGKIAVYAGEGTAANASNIASITWNGETYTENIVDGAVAVEAINYAAYYVNSGDVSYSDIKNDTNLTHVRVKGGTLNINGGSEFDKDLTIDGGTVNAGSDAWKYTEGSYTATNTITINGGELATGSNRITISSGNTIFMNGGLISGTGDDHGALDFFNDDNANNTTSVIVNGDAEISAKTRLRKGTVDFDVAEGKTLTISGVLQKSPSPTQNDTGGVKKSGLGTLKLTGANTYTGGTKITGGTVVVGSASALGTGGVEMSSGTKLQIATNDTVALSSISKTDSMGGVLELIGGNVDLKLTGTLELDRLVSTATSLKIDFGTSGRIDTTGESSIWGGGVNIAKNTPVTFIVSLTEEQVATYNSGNIVFDERILLTAKDPDTTNANKNGIWNLGDSNALKILVEITEGVYLDSSLYQGRVSSADEVELGKYAHIWQENTADGTSYFSLVVNIPEPSAFGLLAGVGALALVASRRRRRSR